MGAVLWEDFLRHFFHDTSTNEDRQVQVVRAVMALLGAMVTILAYLASTFPGVAHFGQGALGVLVGPLLAIFVLGFFTTAANKVVRLQAHALYCIIEPLSYLLYIYTVFSEEFR